MPGDGINSIFFQNGPVYRHGQPIPDSHSYESPEWWAAHVCSGIGINIQMPPIYFFLWCLLTLDIFEVIVGHKNKSSEANQKIVLESEIALERYVKFQTSITNLPLNMISQGYLTSTKSNVFTSRKVDIIGIEQSIK